MIAGYQMISRFMGFYVVCSLSLAFGFGYMNS